MSTPVRAWPSPATSSLSIVCGQDREHSISATRVAHPAPPPPLPCAQPHLSSHIGLLRPALAWPGLPYHDGIAGPCGQKYVVRVCRDASVSPLNVLRHILPDRLDS